MIKQDLTPTEPDTRDPDRNSLEAIRDLLATEDTIAPKPATESRQAKAARASLTSQSKSTHFSPLTAQPEIAAQAKPKPKPTRQPQHTAHAGDGIVDRLKARVLGYRPTVKHIVLTSIALLVFFRPWLVFGLLFLFAFVMTGVFLIFGYDGFWRQMMNISRWYARKHPSRSAEIHRKLDNFAMKFDAFLDRFPEGSVDGLYLPDFGDLAAAEEAHDEALDRRFENLRENEA